MAKTTHPRKASEALASVDHLFREKAGQLTATLTRIFGLAHLDLVEDAVQDAFVTALKKWQYHGVPENPSAWIVQVARNRALDVLRRKGNWGEKSQEVERSLREVEEASGEAEAAFRGELRDDQLKMIFACCHPALPQEAQVALTLKTVGGLSVSEIARAFLARNSAIAQRIVRAKRSLKQGEVELEIPPPGQLTGRLEPVLEVLYLLFNEGYSALEGEDLVRHDLCLQAIRFGRLLAAHPLVATPGLHALLALFLFQGSRLPARVDGEGELLLLSEQDRGLWDRQLIAQGIFHMEKAARGESLSRFHLEAEIASCHALAPSWEETDWPRILAAYDLLLSFNPSPVVALNRAVALSQIDGPKAGIDTLRILGQNPKLRDYAPFHASFGELHHRAGNGEEAARHFERALRLTVSQPVRRFLLGRLGR